jgi:hypothetical protein
LQYSLFFVFFFFWSLQQKPSTPTPNERAIWSRWSCILLFFILFITGAIPVTFYFMRTIISSFFFVLVFISPQKQKHNKTEYYLLYVSSLLFFSWIGKKIFNKSVKFSLFVVSIQQKHGFESFVFFSFFFSVLMYNACLFVFRTLANAAFFFVSLDRYWRFFRRMFFAFESPSSAWIAQKKILTRLSIFFCALLSHSLERSFSLWLCFLLLRVRYRRSHAHTYAFLLW